MRDGAPALMVLAGMIALALGVAGLNENLWAGILTLGIEFIVAGLAWVFFWDDLW